MNLGEKIVKLRKEKGMSQEKLAEALGVSRQAVYKWEINESVPDMEKIAKMVNLFNVSYDFLLNEKVDFVDKIETSGVEETPPPVNEEPEAAVIEAPVVPKPLGVCAICGKEIYEKEELIEHPAQFTLDGDGNKVLTSQAFTECRSCQNRGILKAKRNELNSLLKRNKLALIWGITVSVIVFIVCLITAIATQGNGLAIVLTIISGVLLFPMLYSIILGNTFAGELWLEVSSWGFVRMPGIIFSLSFDGIIFLIATKILLSILAIALAVACMLLATALCLVLSPISFPLSLVRYKNKKLELEASINSLSK